MNRFAVLTGSADPQRARRVADDMTRRHGLIDRVGTEGGALLLQTGPGGIRAAGPLTLAGDLGLTDLADLRGTLSLPPEADAADLILSAWLRWGEDALHHLSGAFAFAIHDRRDGRVTAVRDRFGIRPLAYATPVGGLILAQDLSSVLAGLGTDPGPDPVWIAEFLAGQALSATATAYAGIQRLPAGHLMVARPGAIPALRQWYRLQDTAPPPPVTDLPQALRAALGHATREACSAAPTATMLSGGLDSSSLALLSVEGRDGPPRPALSLRYRDPALDEGPYIEAVLARAQGRLAPVPLPGEAGDALFDLDPQLDEQDQPVFAPGMTGSRLLYRRAQQLGAQGILDGHGGDEIIGGAFADIVQLAGAGRWPRAANLAVRHARFTGSAPSQDLGLLLTWHGRRGFGRLGRWLAPQDRADPIAWRQLVDPALAARTDLVDRMRAANALCGDSVIPAAVQAQVAIMSAPQVGGAFEVLDRAARGGGVVPHYPFYDHRVVELCIWQPPELRIRHGQPRAMLREAMRGVLPELVRLRRDKTNFLADFWATLRRDPTGRMAALRSGRGALEGWVDPAALRADLARLDAGPADPQAAFRLWRAVWLSAWLQHARRPVAVPIAHAPEHAYPVAQGA